MNERETRDWTTDGGTGPCAEVQILSQPAVKPGQPVCLVLAPTRELAQQTARVFDEAGAKCGVRCVCVYGGSPKHEQKRMMREGGGCAVIVATPGQGGERQQLSHIATI